MAEIPFDLKISNFLAIKEGDLTSNNPLTVLVAPNRAGKTQIQYLLYSIFRSHWQASKKGDQVNDMIAAKWNFDDIQNVFLLDEWADYINWSAQEASVTLQSQDFFNIQLSLAQDQNFYDKSPKLYPFQKGPIYLSPAGLADYHKGIEAISRFYSSHNIISTAVTDFIQDVFIVHDSKTSNVNQQLLQSFQDKFEARFFIENDTIQIEEKGKRLAIENAASGLKSLSWLYLMVKYNLLGEVLFLDEPEVNLHPAYQTQLAAFIAELIDAGVKVFLSTHSDYLLEAVNKNIKSGDFKADVWQGTLTDAGAIYQSYEANAEQLIDTSPLNESYVQTIKELFQTH